MTVRHRLESLLTDGGLARAVSWIFVGLIALQYYSVDPSRESALASFLPSLALVVWDTQQDRIGRVPSVVFGIGLVVAGFVLTHQMGNDIGISLGWVVLALVLRARFAVPAVVVILGPSAWLWSTLGVPTRLVVAAVAGEVLFGLVVFLLQSAAIAARRLRDTREELAQTEVDAERDRLAQELNNLLGQMLHQVKDQTAEAKAVIRRGAQPLVDAQLDDMEQLVARGIEQLDRLSFEPVVDDLDDEISTAQTLCTRMGVDFTAAVAPIEDEDVSKLAGLLLRESITNMFKHSSPTRCVLVARVEPEEGTLISITNDGVTDLCTSACGSGQRRWLDQIEDLGGTLVAGPLDGGRYRVLVRIPARERVGSSAALTTTHHPKGP